MAYSKQTWDTTSYVNPTRMNHIEQGIADASTATGTEYSSGVSVKDKIDNLIKTVSYTHQYTITANGQAHWSIQSDWVIPAGYTPIAVTNITTGLANVFAINTTLLDNTYGIFLNGINNSASTPTFEATIICIK